LTIYEQNLKISTLVKVPFFYLA